MYCPYLFLEPGQGTRIYLYPVPGVEYGPAEAARSVPLFGTLTIFYDSHPVCLTHPSAAISAASRESTAPTTGQRKQLGERQVSGCIPSGGPITLQSGHQICETSAIPACPGCHCLCYCLYHRPTTTFASWKALHQPSWRASFPHYFAGKFVAGVLADLCPAAVGQDLQDTSSHGEVAPGAHA